MKRSPGYLLILLATLIALACPPVSGAVAGPVRPAHIVEAVILEGPDNNQLTIKITGDKPPIYNIFPIFDPPRLVIDLADARFSDQLNLPADLPRGPLREVRKLKSDFDQPQQRFSLVRLELLLDDERAYTTRLENNQIVISFAASPPQDLMAAAVTGKRRPATLTDKTGSILADLKQDGAFQGIREAVNPLIPPLSLHLGRQLPPEITPKPSKIAAPTPKKPLRALAPHDPALVNAYRRERISVDFFKTDLHNVFRLFGEIGQINVVVAEGVRGDLTLSLNDVPWDFALDVILNLKDLQKEERFNTIVITPKAQAFTWPGSPAEQIKIRADDSLERLEAITVRQRLKETPRAHLEAKDLIQQAMAHERRAEFSPALALYEQALALWPTNSGLAERMATISLVHLGNNARAVHFAKVALRHDQQNDQAALLAAIALANMQRSTEAKGFFDLAISQPWPTAEALISYSAFAEKLDSPHGALALLIRKTELHGDTVESMLTRARLYDRLGAKAKATAEYRSLLFSGHPLPDDLRHYLQERTTASTKE